jgi:hypothetical protein
MDRLSRENLLRWSFSTGKMPGNVSIRRGLRVCSAVAHSDSLIWHEEKGPLDQIAMFVSNLSRRGRLVDRMSGACACPFQEGSSRGSLEYSEPFALLAPAELGLSGESLPDAEPCALLPRMDLGCFLGLRAYEESCRLLCQKDLGFPGIEHLVRTPYCKLVALDHNLERLLH